MENFVAQWGVILAILALAATLGGGLIAFGRFQGKIGEKTTQCTRDIEALWKHQKGQDTHCQVTTSGNSSLMAKLETMMENLQKNSDEVRADVKELLREGFGR